MPHFDVTVVGELNLDLILYGLPPQLEPERELMADGLALTLGSSSAIFAHNLAVMGSKVGFISRIGEDPLGEIALARLAAGGVDVSQVRKVAGPTSTGLTVILPRTGWPQHPDLSRHHAGDVFRGLEFGLPCGGEAFSPFLVLPAPRSAPTHCRVVPADEAARPFDLARHQR